MSRHHPHHSPSSSSSAATAAYSIVGPDPTLHISRDDLTYIAHAQRSLPSTSSSSRPSSSSSSASISLDHHALAQLSAHFDELLAAITSRVDSLSQQTHKSTSAHHKRAQSVAEAATREMDRLREILRQCDELQNEFLKIRRIGEIVKGFRTRVELLEQRIGK